MVAFGRTVAGEIFVRARTRPRPEARLRSDALGKVRRSHMMIARDDVHA